MAKNKKNNLECGNMKANAIDMATNCRNEVTDCGGGCCGGGKNGNKKK